MRNFPIMSFAFFLFFSTGTCAAEISNAKLDQQILALIKSQNFDKLETTLRKIESDYEKDYRKEMPVDLVFDSFNRATVNLDTQLGNWIKTKPNSYLAYTARGVYYSSLGWAKRKGDFASNTTSKQFDGMSDYFQKAYKDFEQARSINKKMLHPLCFEMAILMNYGEKEKIRKLYEEALQINPMSLTARWQYMTTILPRWGGSIKEMEEVVVSARPYYEKNPALMVLDGRVAAELGDEAYLNKDCPKAEHFYTEALKSGGHWYYYKARGENYYCLGKYDLSIRDLNDAITLRPNIVNVYSVSFLKGNSFYALHQYEKAIPFLSNQIEMNPSDHKTIDLRGDCYMRLGKLELALSDFEKAIRLAPENSEYLADRERIKQMKASNH